MVINYEKNKNYNYCPTTYNMIIIGSVIISLSIAFIFLILFRINFYLFVFLSLIFSYLLIFLFKKKALKIINIKLNNDSLEFLDSNQKVLISDIVKYKIKKNGTNFPYIVLKLSDRNAIKIRSSEKVGDIDKLFEFIESKVG